MDLRWQLVLGTVGRTKAPFGQGTLVRFRARLIEHDLDQRLIDRTVELAKKTGKFGWQKLRAALDSSPLRGCGRVEDSWNLIGRAMSKLVAALARLANVPEDRIVEEAGLTILEGPSVKTALDIDWDDTNERREALQRVVAEADALLTWARRRAAEVMEEPQVREAAELLERIIEQDTEPDPDHPGDRRIRKGVAPDRICSVGDHEMRHGRKSQTKAFNGYKRHIATLVDAPLIVGAVALPANTPECEAVPKLLPKVQEHGPLEELLMDRGYLGHADIARLHREGVAIRCRPWPSHARPGHFPKEAFRINLRERTVECPAGQVVGYSRKTMVAHFGAERCNGCRERERCTDALEGRTIRIHPEQALLRKLEKQRGSKSGRRRLRERVVVEHRLARVQLLQGGRARYKGTRKNTADLRRQAAVINLLEIQTALAA
jgi:hypothetical protein